ncbi:MAG: hypothetical protein OH337_03665 [Candidatus Parvarchaeota archaeon]|nr:hypothetical protein [Candidatus Haiyanarchaeum thermophilum]
METLTDIEEWLDDLIAQLDPKEIIVPTEGTVVGYVWNARKQRLRFINEREAERLSQKGIVWKRLGEI